MKRMIFLVLGMMLCYGGFSQEIKSYVISSTGASIMGADGALYLSIGEPMNTEISDGEIMISQGFLQVSISESTGTVKFLEEEINVYPNPTSSNLIIEMPEMIGDYQYQLFNGLGKDIQVSDLETTRTSIDLNFLSPGTYYLKVNKGSESSRTLKIVKL